eukprot:TRINITY_DN12406_c0_g1_i1.p1 TRINITY_DN12406_c0_g1~~TRINITY_DN12406_c0_g1_i1.p1  ORF type:complete len:135 (+),score=9.26 TRINITY_DN12406_c0_g1_i1:215-619(+)
MKVIDRPSIIVQAATALYNIEIHKQESHIISDDFLLSCLISLLNNKVTNTEYHEILWSLLAFITSQMLSQKHNLSSSIQVLTTNTPLLINCITYSECDEGHVTLKNMYNLFSQQSNQCNDSLEKLKNFFNSKST